MAFLFHDWIPWLHILCVTCIIFSSKISINIFIKLFWYAWWHMDRAAVRETQHGNHATQMCPLAHWATMYIQQTVHNVTAIFTSLATETQPQQMWRTVTAIYTRLPAETWWQQFFRRLSNCDALSQVISLVLLTASLELLGFGIRSRQAISIPKRKVLLVSPLRRLPYRAVDRGAFAISFIPSRQARNGSLLTLSKLHLLSCKRLINSRINSRICKIGRLYYSVSHNFLDTLMV